MAASFDRVTPPQGLDGSGCIAQQQAPQGAAGRQQGDLPAEESHCSNRCRACGALCPFARAVELGRVARRSCTTSSRARENLLQEALRDAPVLGAGGFGVTKLVRDARTGEPLAVKLLPRGEQRKWGAEAALREVLNQVGAQPGAICGQSAC